ncbi:legumain-like [Antedon mediterranea]|uniref:legumain-like n=1 Tax=Antedon mediterranea TaxID=105859 RepID=UPI003AF91AA1
MLFVSLLLVSLASVNCRIFPEIQDDFEGKNWALIVAGSNGWDNYRHQADVCHAYQILHRNGIPDKQIVVMMYDDIANNEENKRPGVIINHPAGDDVYHGVPKDYNGEDVTPKNFLNILQGKKSAMAGIGSGKVIESGPNDNVFVYFTDHGAPGLIAFPSEELHAKDLITALNSMYNAKQYAKLVFYLEACESGSMFKDLSSTINIYATSAANGKESSYACYFDKTLEVYLGDLYSVKWMEDSDTENLGKESLHKQYKIVRTETNLSHVQEFGDMKMSKCKVGDFQGDEAKPLNPLPFAPLNAIPSPEVPMAILYHKLEKASSLEEMQKIRHKIEDMKRLNGNIHKTIETIVSQSVKSEEDADRIMQAETKDITDWNCYKQATTKFSKQCYTLGQHDYAMTLMGVLVNLCEEPIETSIVLQTIDKVCKLETNKV